jgi:hypothetical protein
VVGCQPGGEMLNCGGEVWDGHCRVGRVYSAGIRMISLECCGERLARR